MCSMDATRCNFNTRGVLTGDTLSKIQFEITAGVSRPRPIVHNMQTANAQERATKVGFSTGSVVLMRTKPVWRSLVAQAICNRQVVGSNPSTGSRSDFR